MKVLQITNPITKGAARLRQVSPVGSESAVRPERVEVTAGKEKQEIFNVQIRSGDPLYMQVVQEAELSYGAD